MTHLVYQSQVTSDPPFTRIRPTVLGFVLAFDPSFPHIRPIVLEARLAFDPSFWCLGSHSTHRFNCKLLNMICFGFLELEGVVRNYKKHHGGAFLTKLFDYDHS